MRCREQPGKKLIAAARHLVNARALSPADKDDLSEELGAWSVPAEQIALITEGEEEADFELHPDNWPIVLWFAEVADLLRWNGRKCLGLDVTAVKHDADLSGRQVKPDTYRQLRTFARTVAEELNSRVD